MAVLWCVLGLLLLFFLVALVRALRFTPRTEAQAAAPQPLPPMGQAAAEHLARMVRCKTVSSRVEAQDEAPFTAFRALLKECYPRVFAQCEYQEIGARGMLFRLPGERQDSPTVLMAHYDVVPAVEADWKKPPFSGLIEGGEIWGRGTLDTKGTLCAVLEAAEALLAVGFRPERDVYFSFGGDEEIMGESTPAIVQELARRGVRPGLVLDEGGAIVEGMFPGVKEKTAVVGVCEKGQMELVLSCAMKAGHTSAPPPKTNVAALCRAVDRVARHPAKAKLTPPAAAMFDTLGRHASFGLRLVFANLWCFWPILRAVCTRAGGELGALVRTTSSFTMLQGSGAFNAFPSRAEAHADVRILSGETMDEAEARVRRAVKDPSVEVRRVKGCEPSSVSPSEGQAWEHVRQSILETWPGVVVSPYMMVARSDSSHYCALCENVLRFSAMELSREERGRIHGVDERIPVEKLQKAVEFFARVLQRC
jgi:carboxypeptidase PM20D1